jgi:hypothetical protein
MGRRSTAGDGWKLTPLSPCSGLARAADRGRANRALAGLASPTLPSARGTRLVLPRPVPARAWRWESAAPTSQLASGCLEQLAGTFTGTSAGLALAAVYGGVRMAMHQASRTIQLRLGPFIRAERVGSDAVRQL